MIPEHLTHSPRSHSASLELAVQSALDRIAPLWPLEHFVAVNPFLGYLQHPFADACSQMRQTSGKAPLQSPDEYLQAWRDGKISETDLAAASDSDWPIEHLLEGIQTANSSPAPRPIPSFAAWLDETKPHAHWRGLIAEEIAKWCAVQFDRNQTTWVSPWRHMELYPAWKEAVVHDRKLEAFGLSGLRKLVRSLPDDSLAAIEQCVQELDLGDIDHTGFFHRQLLDVSGWAGHLAYLVREDKMRGNANPALRHLLAIRIAYETALYRQLAGDSHAASAWKDRLKEKPSTETDQLLSRWQLAYESGYQRKLAQAIVQQPAHTTKPRPTFQAVFCIDVRSELLRRHLEAALDDCQTLGFAGFFGVPVAHQPACASRPSPRCPVLLVPPIVSRERRPNGIANIISEKSAWKAFQNSAVSCFTFVESLGIGFAHKLIKSQNKNPKDYSLTPELVNLSKEDQATMVEGALRGMSLTNQFAQLIMICGHGSHSANNPYASSLDCGACGGHAGDVNARIAASILNDMEVRSLLENGVIQFPDDTHFVAAKHDTLSDDVLLYDLENAPASHLKEILDLESALIRAGAATRRERASRLGIETMADEPLEKAIRSRGCDIAELRPEWGLANNAAFIAAPRARTASLKLDGRVFLHEYDPTADTDSKILTSILTAPVVVASWINLQYYASRIDPEHFAAGNKTIHQVVAGIGVIEGNAGDLRSGLPLQSIHNGKEFVHEPRRLSVIIENTPSRIDAVLDDQISVKELVDHQWIHLIAIDGERAYQRHKGIWRAIACKSPEVEQAFSGDHAA
ncbi:MAG: YbcC family protein [Luteolibacter sp.]